MDSLCSQICVRRVVYPRIEECHKERNAHLEQNGIRDLNVLPLEKKAVGRRWIYTMKLNPGRSLAHLKARLVAKGYSEWIIRTHSSRLQS